MNLVLQDPKKLLVNARSDRAFRIQQIRQSIYANIAKSMRKAARSWHVQVDKCARAQHKRGGIVECKRCEFHFKFTADDAESLLGTFENSE